MATKKSVVEAPAAKAPKRKKVNTRWRRGAQRFVPNKMMNHPCTGEEMTEAKFIERYAREKYGWHRGARVVPPGGRSMRRSRGARIEQYAD